MMLSDHIKPECVKIGLEGSSKAEVIEELVEVLSEARCGCDADTILDAVMKREHDGSTGLEMGVAIPHAKCDAIDRLSIVVGVSKNGVDFESQDGKPSNLFFMMLAPRNESGPHVQAIAKIVKLIKVEGFRKKLLKASTPAEVIEVIKKVEEGEY